MATYIPYNGPIPASVGPVAPNGNQAVTTANSGMLTGMKTIGGVSLPAGMMDQVINYATNPAGGTNTQIPTNWQGLDQGLVDYLTKQKAAAAYDGGIAWAYDPNTQTFNGMTMGGTVTKSLADMQKEAAGQNPVPTGNQVVDPNFYNSQIYKDFLNNPNNMYGTMDMYESPYFGWGNSGSVGRAQDKAYEQYLASLNNPPANTVTPPQPNTGYSFTPTPISNSGSYKTEDWVNVIGGALTGGATGALSAAGVNEAVARLRALGETGLTDYTNLAKEVTKDIEFKPYTITSSLGTTQETAPGVISQTLTPEQQANVDKATKLQGELYGATLPDTTGITTGALTGAETQLGKVGAGQEDLAALRAGYGTAAQGMVGMLGGSTTDMANKLFEQQQAMRTPAQQRQALELENRLRAQGRLGTTTAAYGGTPEQLAMAKAIQEQQASDAFTSMTQAEQMAAAQQARALGLGTATSDMARVQQALTTGDIANAQGLFNIGSAAAQLPQIMRGQNITQAGQVQTQALTPAERQAAQLTAAGTLGGQAATTAATSGRMFGDLVSTGLQERLTSESAAAATRTKAYDAALSALASQGGQTGTAANTIQKAIDSGIQFIGGKLYDAAGSLLGNAVDLLGTAATDMWNALTNQYPAGNNPDEMAGGIITDIGNEIGDLVEGGVDAIKDAWNIVFG